MTMRIIERYEGDIRVECGFVDHSAERGFNSYVDNVLKPVCGADDDALIGWLDNQLDAWEIETERAEGLPFARDVIDALEHISDVIVDRVSA
jgi:hypothetical protein